MFQESCRFKDNAYQVVNSIGKCIQGFTDQEQFLDAWKQLVACHCPYIDNKQMSKQKHFEVRSFSNDIDKKGELVGWFKCPLAKFDVQKCGM